ncbi:3-hydroxyisobutyrate dehydrogenase [Leucobacter ruminantium]|uniref:3-hydroxyisobutyrate dehydrogenase n=1 Tax=Leucobacter ruminantium TaxID=1289170 RepID=A0A939RTS0_9MICO|nr:3-hydroxyisobutyrate dehydrogenase [Leucobacter ruminantium]MBO1804755.1 3-hydroxyisobutyrate dehydrogenase [Leucobacter ruminantium]
MTTIAFIGLGHMGGPMAVNLTRAGFDVTAFDLAPAAREAAGASGIRVAPSASAAAREADVVLTMLPAGRHLIAAYSGDSGDGLLAAARPGTLFLDCSTIAVDEARRAAELAAAAGHRALDAPVSGGVVGAENATLAFMVGGEADDFSAALPLLEAMGRRIVHCGGHGLGQAAKACNNMVLGITQIAVAEAFVLGERLGLEHGVLFDVMNNASAQCWALSTNCPVPGPVPSSPANNDYRPGFAGPLMAKDLGLAEQAIASTGVDAKLGLLAREIYAAYAAGEGSDRDFSGIIDTIREAGPAR